MKSKLIQRLSPERRKELVSSIRAFHEEQFDQEMGDLRAGLLLDFLIREVGPSIYNQALRDAESYLQERLSDMEAALDLADERPPTDAPR